MSEQRKQPIILPLTTSELPQVVDGIKGGATLSTAGAVVTGLATSVSDSLAQASGLDPRVAFTTAVASLGIAVGIDLLQRTIILPSISPRIIRNGAMGCALGIAGCLSAGSQLADHWQEAVNEKKQPSAAHQAAASMVPARLAAADQMALTANR